MKKRYRALTGLTYPDGAAERKKAEAGEACRYRRCEAGEELEGAAPESVAYYLGEGLIEEVRDGDLR
jgi:hypothetical protein